MKTTNSSVFTSNNNHNNVFTELSIPPPPPNSALLRWLSNTHHHKNIPKIKTKPGIYLISWTLLDLTSLFKVRHLGELDPLKDIKYGNQLGLKTVKFCTPQSLKAAILETRVT